MLDDIHREKGACGRYKNKNKREQYDLSLFVTIFTRKKAPAAAIKRKKREKYDFSIFGTIFPEEKAPAAAIKKTKCEKYHCSFSIVFEKRFA